MLASISCVTKVGRINVGPGIWGDRKVTEFLVVNKVVGKQRSCPAAKRVLVYFGMAFRGAQRRILLLAGVSHDSVTYLCVSAV